MRHGSAIAKLLVQHGACGDLLDSSRSTPLHYAASSGATDIVALLLTHSSPEFQPPDPNRQVCELEYTVHRVHFY